jgi:hypothetical protein
MKRWSTAARHALVSGTSASVLSTAVLAMCGVAETGSPAAPTNAISHWLWGERAARHDDFSMRHTALGYSIHHIVSILWATLYERWFGQARDRREPLAAVAGGAAVAGLACFVDYQLTPERLKPGYEKRLSRLSLLAVYTAFGAGLVAVALRGARRRPH